eukprot:15474312-Alexandrium_andersonii.AAC.1
MGQHVQGDTSWNVRDRRGDNPLRCAMPGLAARLTRRQVRDVANHLQHRDLTIGQHEVRALPAGPDERKATT